MNSTFLTYPFSSKFHLSMWPLLGLLVQGPEDFAACLKRWETTNTLTNYLSSLAIAVALHAFWSDLPAVMNSPLEEAVRAIKVVCNGVKSSDSVTAVPKPCLFLAQAGGPAGRENELLGGLIRSRLTRPFHVWKYFSWFQKKEKKQKYICKWNSMCNRSLIKCYFGSIKIFHCYEIKALLSKFSLWKLVDVFLCENNNSELHAGKNHFQIKTEKIPFQKCSQSPLQP